MPAEPGQTLSAARRGLNPTSEAALGMPPGCSFVGLLIKPILLAG